MNNIQMYIHNQEQLTRHNSIALNGYIVFVLFVSTILTKNEKQLGLCSYENAHVLSLLITGLVVSLRLRVRVIVRTLK